MMCVIKHRNRLLRENVDALSLEVFEVGLDRSLKKLIGLKMSLVISGGLDMMTLKIPFQTIS